MNRRYSCQRMQTTLCVLLLFMHMLSGDTTTPGQGIPGTQKPAKHIVATAPEDGIHAWLPSSEPLSQSNHGVQSIFDLHRNEGSSECVPDEEGKTKRGGKRKRVMSGSCRAAIDAILRDARAEFNRTKEEILNWSPHSGAKYTDAQLGITEYVEVCTRGTGGIIKARWSDFSVLEKRLDGTDADLNDIETLPSGEPMQYLRFVLLKVRE
jgi:hypothetical protein